MAFTGFASVNIRKSLPITSLPVILASTPRDYALYAAREFINNNGSALSMTQTSNTVGLHHPEEGKRGDSTLLSQTSFTDDDVLWYLDHKKISNKKLIPLIDGNLELVRHAQIAYPQMEYFMSSLKSGNRMKMTSNVVRSCILVATFNNRVIELELPIPVTEYVLHQTPLYGSWLEQHVDKFYELLKRCR